MAAGRAQGAARRDPRTGGARERGRARALQRRGRRPPQPEDRPRLELPGQQRRIVTPGKNEKFYLAGALDVRTGALHTTGLARKGAALFCALLRDLAERYGSEVQCIHLIVDNYAIHSARATLSTLEELGGRIVLHFLPPYCPDANRIERVWQDLHANVTRNHRCKTMKALLGKARNYVDRYVWRRVTGAAAVSIQAADQQAA